jgi:hypothetical protein
MKKFTFTMALFMLLLFSSASSTLAYAGNYAKADLNLGDTADYLVSRSDISPKVVNRMNLLVVNVTDPTVGFNVTFYYTNGSRYQSFLRLGNFSTGYLYQYVIAPNLSPGDPISDTANAPMINETVLMVIMGGVRPVNHLSHRVGGTRVQYYWDKASGLMVKSSDNSTGSWMNFTLVSTSVWSPVAKPIIMALIIIGGICCFVLVAASLILYVRKK